MIENEMEYRGSKSVVRLGDHTPVNNAIVKEQRVDGSWHSACLRCILMGFERNYQVKILSKQINKSRAYSSITTHKPLLETFSINPWFLTGFTDAEGCFSILIQPNSHYKTNWRIKPIFSIGLHKKDTDLLERIKSYWTVGKIHKHGKDSVQYRVETVKDLQIIVDHFDKYPLISAKLTDYILFKKAFYIIKSNEHLSQKGLLNLIGIKASLNLGLTYYLKKAFPNWELVQLKRPEYAFTYIPDPNWIAGFSSGDASFNIKISGSTTTKLGSRVQLRFAIGLNIREKELIKYLATYFKFGNSSILKSSDNLRYIYLRKTSLSLQVVNHSDIMNIIIPFFDKYPIQGKKSLDYSDFKQIAEMINNKQHLTLKGLFKILNIKSKMNEERM